MRLIGIMHNIYSAGKNDIYQIFIVQVRMIFIKYEINWYNA